MGEDKLASLWVPLAVKRIVEEALEGAVRDILGREYYARRGERQGLRNGYRQRRLATGEGEVCYATLKVRDTDAAPITERRKRLSGRREALEKLAIEMYARGCSTRDSNLRRRAARQPALAHRPQRGHRGAVGGVRSLRHV